MLWRTKSQLGSWPVFDWPVVAGSTSAFDAADNHNFMKLYLLPFSFFPSLLSFLRHSFFSCFPPDVSSLLPLIPYMISFFSLLSPSTKFNFLLYFLGRTGFCGSSCESTCVLCSWWVRPTPPLPKAKPRAWLEHSRSAKSSRWGRLKGAPFVVLCSDRCCDQRLGRRAVSYLLLLFFFTRTRKLRFVHFIGIADGFRKYPLNFRNLIAFSLCVIV